MSGENWHKQRDRLVRLIAAVESGAVTHIDEKDLRELQATTPVNVEARMARRAKSNPRLGDG